MEPIKIKKKPSQVLKIEGRKTSSPIPSLQAFNGTPKELSWEPYIHGGIVAIIASFLFASLLFPALPDWRQLNLILNLFIHWISALLLGGLTTFVFCRASNRYHFSIVFWGGILGFLGIFFGYWMRAHQNNLSFLILFHGQFFSLGVSLFSCLLGAFIVVQQNAIPQFSFQEEFSEPSVETITESPRLKLAPKTKKRHRKFRKNTDTRTKIDPHAISHLCPVCVDESLLILQTTPNIIECQVCGAKHHKACWESNGGCGTLSEH